MECGDGRVFFKIEYGLVMIEYLSFFFPAMFECVSAGLSSVYKKSIFKICKKSWLWEGINRIRMHTRVHCFNNNELF